MSRELKLAGDALRAASALRGLTLSRDALARLYYAMFHTLVALLLTKGVEPKRHRAVPELLRRHFAEFLGSDDVKLVAQVETYRDLADYERDWEATDELVQASFAGVESLIARVRAHLVAGGWTAA